MSQRPLWLTYEGESVVYRPPHSQLSSTPTDVGIRGEGTARFVWTREMFEAFFIRLQNDSRDQMLTLPNSYADCEVVVWGRRHNKRNAGVLFVKRTAEYTYVANNNIRPRPLSPDPWDRNISKRSWERRMQAWRDDLANIVSQHQEEQGA